MTAYRLLDNAVKDSKGVTRQCFYVQAVEGRTITTVAMFSSEYAPAEVNRRAARALIQQLEQSHG